MPSLNWDNFKTLPGSAEKNFELLCRGIVRQNFGSYGVFRALANQPGVEFHLLLDKQNDSLGDPGRWWGWQCKWYELTADGQLGATRRNKISEGIKKSEAHVPGLTDWVLWTRRTLTKADQDWFNALSSKMRLHLWTGDEVDNLLAGQAAILRSTYFGEMVMTPEILRELHEKSVAPIRIRWMPNVHHTSEAERNLRRMLGETASWDVIGEISADLVANANAIETSPSIPPSLKPSVDKVIDTSKKSANMLNNIADSISNGDLDLLREELNAHYQRKLPIDVATTPRKLRSCNHRAGLYATNAVAGCHDATRLLENVGTAFSSRIVAVLARAGCGKTHLAAQLTSKTADRPHGILMHGQDLHAAHSLDDLARHVSIAAQPVPSMEGLLAAVDAAGQRARHRLPVFIDGLNESEDPRAWKRLLASLDETLTKYPFVLLICSLRPEFADDVLPDETRRVEIVDYGEETIEAINEHFRYWKIDATDALLPGFLRHPLTLRIFCEVTNPTRRQIFGVNAMPGSQTALFDRYLEQVGDKVVQLASRAHRFYAHDVNAAIATIANKLWESHTRSIEASELRELLDDARRPWDQSLVRALEHEGVLLRMPENGIDAYVPAYDQLGGHIIANALLAKHGHNSFEKWINEPATIDLLAGDYSVRHPLAEDVLLSLVGQVPRRFHAKQLWQSVGEPLRERALRLAAHLEPTLLDAATVDAILGLVHEGDAEIFDRLWAARGSPGHPLNAEALDRTLRALSVADRDLQWTEWLRNNQIDVFMRGRSILRDLEHLEQRWKTKQMRTGDYLRARWVMWTLTSTIRRLRDQATRVLYWFGRTEPEKLFALTIDSLTINDAYISERMLAASYGVVMSHQHADTDFSALLKPFLKHLADALTGVSASAPTHHYLARHYVKGIVAFTAKFCKSCLPPSFSSTWSFTAPTPVNPLINGTQGAIETEHTLHMDFENYTLGGLFDDRRNYDMEHKGHQAAVAYVRGVVWALGWRTAKFDLLDRSISEDTYRYAGRGNRPHAERYGKKYGWIGFFNYAGLLDEQGKLQHKCHEFSDVDIDPSFPEQPPIDGAVSLHDAWLLPDVKEDKEWILKRSVSVPRNILRRETIGGHHGPWIAVHGFLEAKDRVLGRMAWAFISALVTNNGKKLVSALRSGAWPWVSHNVPSDYYIFAGEIPWHPNFASVALAECAYREKLRSQTGECEVEILAHGYAWESHHSEMNTAGTVRVPSKSFSMRHDLRSAPQTFKQLLPDGSVATITLSGIDGLDADILYIREDLLIDYIGERAIVWLTSGERELRPYPPSPPEWLIDAQKSQANAWREVLTETDLKRTSKLVKWFLTKPVKGSPT